MSKFHFIITFLFIPLFVLANEPDKCGNNEEARALVSLIKSDIEQKRTSIRCNSILTKAAEEKTEIMRFKLAIVSLYKSTPATIDTLCKRQNIRLLQIKLE